MRDSSLKTTLKKKMDALARRSGAAKTGGYTTALGPVSSWEYLPSESVWDHSRGRLI
jgi:hypothetical protein